MLQGHEREIAESLFYHKKYSAVLISPLTLRDLGLGQIDVAYLKKVKCEWTLTIVEVKSLQMPGPSQFSRLKNSANFLAEMLQIPVFLKVKLCQKNDLPLS